MKRSIVIYDSWGELINNLPDEAAGELIKMICKYSFDAGTDVSNNEMINAMFMMIKAKLDEDSDSYEEAVKKRSEAGKKGMKKRWNDNNAITDDNTVITNDNNVKPEITNITVSVSDSVSDSVSVSDKDKKKKGRFTPPSLTEVKAYCLERNNGIDPEAFIDFYASKGWKVGNQPMKDWKACIRTWERRDDGRASPKENKGKFDDIAARLISETMGDCYNDGGTG